MRSALVLDDTPADRDLIATVLRYAGFEVLEAATGEEALELARSARPELIIADLVMPGMNGYEFTRALRADELIRETPVVFCTATFDERHVRPLAEACGVSHILIKPCEPGEITRVVEEVLGSTPDVAPIVRVEQFDREVFRVINEKLVEKVHELEQINHQHHQLQEELGQAKRQTDEALTLLESLQSSAPVGFGFVDRELRCRRVNETLAELAGLPVEQIIGRRVEDVVPKLWAQLGPACVRVLETGQPVVNLKTSGKTAAAPEQIRHWLVSLYPVRIEDELIGVGVVVVDVTERERASELRSVVMETIAEGLYVLDADGQLLFMNPAASKMLGWTEEELRGKSVHPIIHFQRADGSEYPESECAQFKVRTDGRTVRLSDDAFTRKNGSILPVSYSATPLMSGTSVAGVVVVFRDKTAELAEQTRAEREFSALAWVARTRDALDDGLLVLYAQPIVTIDGVQHSEELLVRMIGRAGEIIPPGAFLPVAEKYGLIGEVDQWVIKQAAARAATGRRVEANLSAESLGNLDLLPLIEQELRDAGADPKNLVFEITETALMTDIKQGEAFARGLAKTGCGLALDDFGTGFGSFNLLKTLPIQYLKIDIEFVRDLSTNRASTHLVKAIVNLAQGFGLQTIAEGVEDAETLELLREYGVDFAQGYYLGRPAPLTRSREAISADR
jgi:PAS domain S-box-containing protein